MRYLRITGRLVLTLFCLPLVVVLLPLELAKVVYLELKELGVYWWAWLTQEN